jgi:mono/diheme cytochrome c family protein
MKSGSVGYRHWLGEALLGLALTAPFAATTAQQTTGDATRGEPLFSKTYKCYACHGYDAQTGERRLRPMNYTEDGFITFVQNSPLPAMPAFPDVSRSDLADIYAYILTIPIDAPDIEDIPLLEEIRDAKLKAMSAD